MDVQTVLDTALAANATNLAAAEAGIIFRKNLSSAIKIGVNLTPGQMSHLKKIINFPIVFTGGKTVTNDHPLLVAVRDIVRESYARDFKIQEAAERVLIVGAAAREIAMYSHNPHIHYYVYGKESKDYDRIVRPALQEIGRKLKQKAGKNNKLVFKIPGPGELNLRPCVKRYNDFQQIFKDYMELNLLPSTIHVDKIKCNTLAFEDSFYNFKPIDYLNLFEETGAEIAFGYGLLPLELLFEDMPENPIYSLTSRSGISYLTFRQGFANGYAHDTEAWSTLLKSPVIEVEGKSLKLAVEICCRAGPAVTFKMYKIRYNEEIPRLIELPDSETYVKILDIKNSVNRSTGKINNPLIYFSVREDEYIDTFNYLMSLDPKSLSFQNTVAYVRRRMGGMSLITKELIAPWFLPKRKVEAFCTTVLIQAKLHLEERTKLQDNLGVGSVYEKIAATFRTIGRMAFLPLTLLIDWLFAGHLVDKLILYPSGSITQIGKVTKFFPDFYDIPLHTDWPYEGDIPSCPVCFELMGKLGDQHLTCNFNQGSAVELELNDQQINKFKTDLLANDEDPAGLKAVKERCLKAMPTTGFKRKVFINLIEAGPGCGKSYLIRQLATTTDLILAPFTKLKADYMDLNSDDGEKYDLNFKTAHRAMETRGCRRIFVDEFTSMPYEFLACVAEVNGAEEIFLVGDTKQTKVLEPTEGLYIGNHINLSELSNHVLNVNFRNPKDTVALLNKIYGYQMEAFSKKEKSIEIVSVADLPPLPTSTRMAFTKVSAKAHTESETNTVRANQGGTCNTAVLYATSNDAALISNSELQIVGLSRHTEKLYIVVDGCEQSKQLENKLQLSAEFYDHLQTWLTFPREATRAVLVEDKVVGRILEKVQAPSDSYRLIHTMMPSAANHDFHTCMNNEASSCIAANFTSGVTGADKILAVVNKRGHPQDQSEKYYSLGQGVGNYFSAKNQMQTLQVMSVRYFCKQPMYPYGWTEELLIRKILDKWFDDCVNPDVKVRMLDTAEMQDVIDGFIKHITTKKYQDSFKGNDGIDNPDGRTIRFNLKGIFKPKHGEPDVNKAGQGISAWSTDACAMFCAVFRVLTASVVKSELGHVVTDAYMDEAEFIKRTQYQMNRVAELAQNATTDGVCFDANQNQFTQELEKAYWRRYGVCETFLDHYYSFRRHYKVVSAVALGRAGTQKTSGEPGTLVNNGVVSKTISHFLIDGDGGFVINYKGDDFNKRQLNVRLNKPNQDLIDGVCAVKLRVKISSTSEFCGLTYSGGNLLPSIPRKINKLYAHRFKTYEHFCEYQAALRDWVSRIEALGEMLCVASNANVYGTTADEMQSALDTVKSFSHIDKDQWDEQFVLRTETVMIPKMGSDGKICYSEY